MKKPPRNAERNKLIKDLWIQGYPASKIRAFVKEIYDQDLTESAIRMVIKRMKDRGEIIDADEAYRERMADSSSVVLFDGKPERKPYSLMPWEREEFKHLKLKWDQVIHVGRKKID